MQRRFDRDVTGRDDQRAIVQECSIERRKGIALEFDVTAQMRLYQRAVFDHSRCERLDHDAGFIKRKLRHVHAVDEYQTRPASGKTKPSISAALTCGVPRAGWNGILVSGEISVKRHSSSRVVGTVSAPTRSTACERSWLNHA